MARKPAPLKVWINGAEVACPVVERLGYNHDAGAYAAIVLHDGREQTAVKEGQRWRLWGAKDRVRPLVEHIERCARQGRDPFPA
jgi:hypothetical protein